MTVVLHVGIVLAMVNLMSNCCALQLKTFHFDQQLVGDTHLLLVWLAVCSPELMLPEDTQHELLTLSHSLISSLVLCMEEVSWVLPVGAMNCGQCTGCERG